MILKIIEEEALNTLKLLEGILKINLKSTDDALEN